MSGSGVTIFEYIKSPHPWFDTTNYTLFQVVLFFIASLFWVVAYIDTIANIINKKTIGIPVIAVALNFGWEVTVSFFFVPDMGKAVVAGVVAWMVLDVFIVINTFKYGHKQISNPFIRKHFKPLFALGCIIAFCAEYFFITRHDLPIAPYDAYIINFVMSVCFINLIFLKDYDGNSLLTAWTKFLGTFWTSVMFQMRYPEDHFLTTLYIATAFFDIFYILLLYKRKKGLLSYAIK